MDEAYAVNTGMQIQTGRAISIRWGVMYAKSGNEKLNTKISTQAEVVGASEYFQYDIWLLMFLLEQGYIIVNNILYQDNQSSIKMEINWRNYFTVNSSYVNIQYFFVKDRVDKVEVNIEYCPTHEMWTYFVTNPPQENFFHKFRYAIMGYKHITTPLNGKL